MTTKQIIFDKPYSIVIADTEYTEPDVNEALVEIEYTTISNGTERANLTGEKNVSIVKDAVVGFPRYCGYSGAGIVRAVGENVTKVKVGDRVACSWGTHKKMQSFPAECVELVPDGVELSDAAMVHISTFPLGAIRKTRLEIGESAMVVGLGILGMLAVKQLVAAGAATVIAVDTNKERREAALRFGADFAFDPCEEGFDRKVIELTHGGVNVAIEVTGSGKALDTTLDCMARFGRVALLGCTRKSDVVIDYYKKVHGPGISLIGAHTRARADYESRNGDWTMQDDKKAMLSLLDRKRISFSDMVCEVHSPLEAVEVFERLANDKDFPFCVQFDWTNI